MTRPSRDLLEPAHGVAIGLQELNERVLAVFEMENTNGDEWLRMRAHQTFDLRQPLQISVFDHAVVDPTLTRNEFLA